MSQPTISGYRVVRELGRGGMAVAYLAEQELFERLVALKVMKRSDPSSEENAKRFMREARIIGHMSHPNIVPVYEVAERNGHFFFSMEFLSGGDLTSKIDDGLQLTEVVHILTQIASALDYAHARGVIHRDVKPDNILFRHSGEAVLTDFGIARDVDDKGLLTIVESVVGSPRYMSPEQARGSAVDARSDIFSLGVVMYEMLTGETPFVGSNSAAVALQQTEKIPLSLPSEAKALQGTLRKMTALDPADRYSRALDLADDLRAFNANDTREKTNRIDDVGDTDLKQSIKAFSFDKMAQDYERPVPPGAWSNRLTRFHWTNPALLFLALALAITASLLVYVNQESDSPVARPTTPVAVTQPRVLEDPNQQAGIVSDNQQASVATEELRPGYYLYSPNDRSRTLFAQNGPQPIALPTPEEVYLYSELAADSGDISIEEYAARYPRSVFAEALLIKQGDTQRLEDVEYRAQAGEEAALLILGEAADAGWLDGREDPVKALAYAREAARFDYALGLYQVASILMQNDSASESEALVHLQKAADQGLFLAMNTLADIYANRGGQGGLERALILYRQSADLGDPEAMYKAGKILWEGPASAGARTEARQLLEAAAATGHVNAQLLLHKVESE